MYENSGRDVGRNRRDECEAACYTASADVEGLELIRLCCCCKLHRLTNRDERAWRRLQWQQPQEKRRHTQRRKENDWLHGKLGEQKRIKQSGWASESDGEIVDE